MTRELQVRRGVPRPLWQVSSFKGAQVHVRQRQDFATTDERLRAGQGGCLVFSEGVKSASRKVRGVVESLFTFNSMATRAYIRSCTRRSTSANYLGTYLGTKYLVPKPPFLGRQGCCTPTISIEYWKCKQNLSNDYQRAVYINDFHC